MKNTFVIASIGLCVLLAGCSNNSPQIADNFSKYKACNDMQDILQKQADQTDLSYEEENISVSYSQKLGYCIEKIDETDYAGSPRQARGRAVKDLRNNDLIYQCDLNANPENNCDYNIDRLRTDYVGYKYIDSQHTGQEYNELVY